MTKFFSERYPFLHIKLPCKKHVRFENGVFLTDDEQIISELRKHIWYQSNFHENRPAEWVVKSIEKGGTNAKEESKRKEEVQEVVGDEDLDKILI